ILSRLSHTFEDEFLLDASDQLLRLYDLVRIDTHANSSLAYEELDDFGIVRRRLATDRGRNTRLATDPDNMTHRPQHCKIPLVVNFLYRRIVPVDPENQHRQIIRPKRDPVNTLLDKFIDQQYRRGNLAHNPELEIRTPLQPLFLH